MQLCNQGMHSVLFKHDLSRLLGQLHTVCFQLQCDLGYSELLSLRRVEAEERVRQRHYLEAHSLDFGECFQIHRYGPQTPLQSLVCNYGRPSCFAGHR